MEITRDFLEEAWNWTNDDWRTLAKAGCLLANTVRTEDKHRALVHEAASWYELQDRVAEIKRMGGTPETFEQFSAIVGEATEADAENCHVKWQLVYDVVACLGQGWSVDTSGDQGPDWRALVGGPGGMRLFFIAPKGKDWLRVTGRFLDLDETLKGEISIGLQESLGAANITNEIIVRLLPIYEGFLATIEKHNSQIKENSAMPLVKKLTEQEAAIFFVRDIREKVRSAWPAIHKNFKDALEEKFIIENETKASFDLALAAIALDLQAVKNLFQAEQADRLERWVLKHIGGVENWGDYAVSEVKEYSSAFQSKMRVDIPIGAISARLVHRWLGHGIRSVEVEIGGQKTAHIDVTLIDAVNETLLEFIGFWKGINTNFPLVEGYLPLDEGPEIKDEDIPF